MDKKSCGNSRMKVYVFGNLDVDTDNKALLLTPIGGVTFIEVKPNQDLPFDKGKDVIIVDTVEGLKKITLITDNQLDKVILPPRSTTHDYDLGFQLKYLKKLGKLGRVTLIGLPMRGKINYKRIHSILRKLVAQDMHGS